MTTTTPVIEKHEARLHTGVSVRYVDVGPRNGESLILLHGFSDSSLSFHPVLELLPPGLRLIIPDQRGHGESECPPQGYTPNEFAMDAIALLDAIGVRSATVVGHSLGSFVRTADRSAGSRSCQQTRSRRVCRYELQRYARGPARTIDSLSDPLTWAFSARVSGQLCVPPRAGKGDRPSGP